MAKKIKSWQEKLRDSRDLPKVVKVPSKMVGRWGTKSGDTLLIPAPIEVDEVMRTVPKGKLITTDEIRIKLARKHKANISCPLTTGIFAGIAAKAAEEAKSEGKQNITPYWRTLKAGGTINEKFPGGVEMQKKLLEKEGHKVILKGKKAVVADFEKSLVK